MKKIKLLYNMKKALSDKSKKNLRVSRESDSSLKNLIPSFLLLVLFLYSSHFILSKSLIFFHDYLDTFMGKYNFIYIPYSLLSVTVNVIFILMYYFDDKYFYKFKINNEPWPWQECPKKWKKSLFSIIQICVRLF